MKSLDSDWASMVLWVGMKITCLVSWSTITRISVWPSEGESCLMKSIEIDSQGWGGIGSCNNGLYGLCHLDLFLLQALQDFTKSTTKDFILGQVNSRRISCWVLVWPGWPARIWSWKVRRTRRHRSGASGT